MELKNQKGFAIPTVVLLILLLAPLVLTFTLWVRKNHEQGVKHRLQLKQFYATESATDFALYRIKKDGIKWNPGMSPLAYQLQLNGQMTVDVDIDFSGF